MAPDDRPPASPRADASRGDEAGPGDGVDPVTDGTGTDDAANGGPENPDIDDLLDKLERLEETVDTQQERHKVRQTIALVERMPGSSAFTRRVKKYTSRDIAESFVGAVIFALPLLVEGGVFEIAAWFAAVWVAGVPVFFLANVVFTLGMTAGLLYFADFRDVEISRPFFGVIPRRYVGVLTVALLTSILMMLMWGRLAEEDPGAFEQVARVSVVWTGGAFGAALGDILPGESEGEDISDHVDDIQEAMGLDPNRPEDERSGDESDA